MIIEILLALFLVLVLRFLDGWVERRRDGLHYVTKPSRARATRRRRTPRSTATSLEWAAAASVFRSFSA
jgi:hypothetical protein